MKKTKLALGLVAALLLVVLYAVQLYRACTPPPPAPAAAGAAPATGKQRVSIGITLTREVSTE